MSLAHKFSWQKFLKQNPDLKKKGVKRTSPEGEKAYKAAFKEFARKYIKEREERLKKEETRATKVKVELVKKLKGVDGKKWHLKAKKLNREIGRLDSYLASLQQSKERTKNLSKEV
ncbi:MAG: hypothetical protein HY609_03175 [Deltaproteobacteria bacterium]|nr:hypothetical protein [Deltaproteobacteria bacterium]MBI4223911.1 hypothetical protein [Deltaproteobacteria bacterium]